MSAESDALETGLTALVRRLMPHASGITGLQRLSAGATLQTWSFDAVGDDGVQHPLILRRSPGGLRGAESLSLPLQAALIRALAGGEPVDPARVRWWQALGSLRWGLGCAGMRDWFDSGCDATVERAMIARRVSENELDLLRRLTTETADA